MPYKIWVKCPKCELEINGTFGDMEKNFGFRKMTGNGTLRPQSQCRKCRSGKGKKKAKVSK
jgi:hypothetical protein